MLKSVCSRTNEANELLLVQGESGIPDQERRIYCDFKELLNYGVSQNNAVSPMGTPAAEQCPLDVDPPSLDEVCTAIR